MIRDIPRYWTGWGISDISLTVSASAIELRLDRGANRGVWGDASRVPPASSSHDQGAAEGRHGPAEVHRDLGVLDRKSTRLNSSHESNSYAVISEKKKC